MNSTPIKKISASAVALLLAACASNPDKMSATYVSPMKYQTYDCDQVAMEGATIERKVGEIYQQLDSKASADAWQMGAGLVLFWPALFFLEGGDGPQAAEYKQLLGEYEALETVAVQKKCGLQFQLPEVKPDSSNGSEGDESHPSDQQL